MSDLLFLIGDIVMFFAIVGALTFTFSYAGFFNWRKTPPGRSLMYFVVSLDAWAIQSFMSRMDPEYVGREWVRLGIYVLIAVTVWRLVAVLWRSWDRSLNIESRAGKDLDNEPPSQ